MKSSIYAKSLSIWVTNFLLCLSLLASLSEVAQSEEDGEIASLQQAEKRLTSLCRDISSITNLKTMQQLIDSLKTVSSKRLEIKRTNSWSFFNYDRMVPCLDNANSIIELEPLISERVNVCKPSHIDLIEAYQKAHTRNKLTRKFFKIYAYQVSTICKQNMARNLVEAEKGLTEDIFEKAMPWVASGDSCDTNMRSDKLEDAFKQEYSDQHIKCMAIEAISSLDNINELVDVMRNDQRLNEDIQSVEGGAKTDSKTRAGTFLISREPTRKQIYMNLYDLIPRDAKSSVDEMVATCKELEAIYQQTVMPIVRLAMIGYDLGHIKFDRKCQKEKSIQRWFSVTLICNSILQSSPSFEEGVESDSETVKTVRDSRGQEKNEFEESIPSWQNNPIEDDLKIAKNIPSSFSRFTTRFVENIDRLLESKQLTSKMSVKDAIRKAGSVAAKVIFVILAIFIATRT